MLQPRHVGEFGVPTAGGVLAAEVRVNPRMVLMALHAGHESRERVRDEVDAAEELFHLRVQA